MSEYPEHDKLSEKITVGEASQTVGEFLDYSKYKICEWDEDCGEFRPVLGSLDKILAEIFDIDLNKFHKEKDEMLRLIRFANQNEATRKDT